MLKKLAKLAFLCLAPLLLALLWLLFFLHDFLTRLAKLFQGPSASATEAGNPAASAALPPRHASIVIPNWNGKDLLEKYLPSVLADRGPQDEIIVVDNASTDGSAEFVRTRFPQVKLLPVDRNLGFGGGCNAGASAAKHAIVVMLNNDMRVTPGFLRALLAGFTDPNVFAVSAQIFFSDPARRREETGLTSGGFAKGFFRVRHDDVETIRKPYPTLYAGGGSSAYDREKFLELGGFDPLFEPFYLEDTDLSYNAWRRGWKVLYQPEARVYHEHRGTIGRHFSPQAIQAYLQKNYVLMVWKNQHQMYSMIRHLFRLYGHMVMNVLGWPTETRTTIGSLLLALRQLPQALRARRIALLKAAVSNTEVSERLQPAIFRDVFLNSSPPGLGQTAPSGSGTERDPATEANRPCRLNILFVSPYPILPPVHGGAVLMLQAIQEISRRHNVFVLTFVESPAEIDSHQELLQWARGVETIRRKHPLPNRFHIRSNAENTFRDPEFAALLGRMIYDHDIDLIQFEYTQMAQYRLPLRNIPQCLFEHDIHFRSVGRQLLTTEASWGQKSKEAVEWLRALRFEVNAVSRFDAIQTCHVHEQRVLESFLNGRPWILPDLRTAIDARNYPYPGGLRLQDSMLFVGNFRHRPNADGLAYFCDQILPAIRQRRPGATLYIAGAAATGQDEQRFSGQGVCFLGQVPDIREPLSKYAVFICPIRTGAGVRVKILEAFASGIPVVSTSLGAEGLAARQEQEILLADSPEAFAESCARLLEQPGLAEALAARARALAESRYDWPVVMRELDAVYRELVRRKRGILSSRPPGHPVGNPTGMAVR